MTTINFPHLQFLETNKDIMNAHPLPEMLQKRILGFEELQEDLTQTTDEDYRALQSKMEKLSYELDEDLEEYFEHQLENNDPEEEDGAGLTQGLEKEPPQTQAPRHDNHALQPMAQTNQHPLRDPLDGKVRPSETPQTSGGRSSDEAILRQALADGIDSIHPRELLKRGFKGSLSSRKVIVAEYILQRGKYDTCFRILRREG